MTSTAAPDPEGSLWISIKRRWRGWLRAVHRDAGYLAVGLTVIYAVSGLAINHLADWDPNFVSYTRERTIAPIAAEVPDDAAIAQARSALAVGTPRSTYRAGDEIHLEFDDKKLVVYGDSGTVIEQGRSSRFFLRIANWLHYNRGKKAWTYVADTYALLLLYLAISGIFMIKGKKGFKWRGASMVALGAAVPLIYVVWSGGPSASNRTAREAARSETQPSAPAPTPDDPDIEPIERMPVRVQPPVTPPAPTPATP